MSQSKDLINKSCQKKVTFYKLGDIVEFRNGKGHEKSIVEDGKYIVVNSKFISTEGEIKKYADEAISPLYAEEVLMVMSDLPKGRALAKCFFVEENDKYTLNQRICALKVKDSKQIIPKYLFYYLNRNIQLLKYDNGADQTNLKKDDILNIKVPVPPLEVQAEIVCILDKFLDLLKRLSIELKARENQLEYYRDSLLDFKEGSKKVRLGEVAFIQRGASPRPIKDFITESEEGVNWIKIGDVEIGAKYITKTKEKITQIGAKKSREVKKGDFILSNSMSFGRPYILAINGCIHDGWLSISKYDKYYNSNFLYHIINSRSIQKEMEKRASFGGAVQNLNADIVKSIELPLPEIEEQIRISNILDKFDRLCHDITEGIPAEIEVRKKQYEYYKDKLLTFKELS